MSFAPSRPPAPDSEAQRLTAPDHPADNPAGRVRALARRIHAACDFPTPDDPARPLRRQAATLGAVFHELVMINTEKHGLDERAGLTIALRAQSQALATYLAEAEIDHWEIQKI